MDGEWELYNSTGTFKSPVNIEPFEIFVQENRYMKVREPGTYRTLEWIRTEEEPFLETWGPSTPITFVEDLSDSM